MIAFFFSYDKRLTTFEKWFHTNSTTKALIQAEFRYTFTKLSLNCITCRRCDLILENWEFHNDFIKEHFRKSSECFRTKKTIEQKIFIVVQEVIKQKIVVVVIKAIKSEDCVKNINFFDFTMQINLWEKFRISINSASFLHHLIEIVVNYREKNIIKMLFQCFRDSALQWLKNQLKIILLNDFKTIIAKSFHFRQFLKLISIRQ